ncbi:aldehyde dehydrogenase family protein [Tessaracoccus coleopterorum]|uniref:aldehyde dehydrogenase family protein n=1 Tax=Tessaracoccus coleopterorum TaxID=2714950 RepID=UPI002F917F42
MGGQWAATEPRVRGEILRRAFELIVERGDDYATLMTLEMGKPLAEARGEVGYGPSSSAGSRRRRAASRVAGPRRRSAATACSP